jgi:ferredoxin-NADP reductase
MNKFLSFSCGPGHGYVEFTKRISQSTFSKALLELKPGDKIHITEAKGHCTLGQPAQKVLYLAGGIGITPVVSMLDNVYSRGDFLDAVLIYANNSPVDAAFKDVFDSWNSKHGFKFECIYNFISDEIIKSLVPDWNERLAFVFGPPAMVKATREVCAKMGYAKDNVLFESFAGYTS